MKIVKSLGYKKPTPV
jgi:superfamily II DNA/RNA helicase